MRITDSILITLPDPIIEKEHEALSRKMQTKRTKYEEAIVILGDASGRQKYNEEQSGATETVFTEIQCKDVQEYDLARLTFVHDESGVVEHQPHVSVVITAFHKVSQHVKNIYKGIVRIVPEVYCSISLIDLTENE